MLSKIVANNILNYFTIQKIRLYISCELSASQTIHMKCQGLFSQKNEKKKLKALSAVVVISALRVNSFLLLPEEQLHGL